MTTHRMTKSPEWYAWQHAKARCNNPRDKEFHRYGAKGIKMCREWEQDFSLFLKEVGTRPTPGHSIDRIDSGKGYEPGNVRWATREVQSRNRPGFVRLLEHNGRTQTVAEWAQELGLPPATLYHRLNEGLPIEQVLATGKRLTGRGHLMLSHNGKLQPLKAWARELKMAPSTIRKRLALGWEVEKALTHRSQSKTLT